VAEAPWRRSSPAAVDLRWASAVLVSDEDRARRSCGSTRRASTLGSFPGKDAARRKVTRILVDGEGGIGDPRTGRRKAAASGTRRGGLLAHGGAAGFKRPVDVAVDAFRNLYVADEEVGVSSSTPRASPSRRSRAPTSSAPGRSPSTRPEPCSCTTTGRSVCCAIASRRDTVRAATKTGVGGKAPALALARRS